MNEGIYIYGIIKSPAHQEFGKIGIGDPAAQVLTLEYQDLAAVVSRNPFVVYDTLAKETIVKDLVMHQFVIEKVMKGFTILPVKFGTMVESEEEALQFLQKGYCRLHGELRKIDEKIELDVVAVWELPKVMATIYRNNAQIQKKQGEIVRMGTKVALEERVALGKSVGEALTAQKIGHQQLILHALKDEVVDICLHELASDEMIFNAAFLLEKQYEESFTQAIDRVDQKLDNSVNFRLVGPLPPYSFSTILLEKIDERKLAEARKTLGLDGEITEKALRDAYHQQAQKCHPDKSKNSKEDAFNFHRLHSAYKTLKAFLENGSMHVEVYRWEKDQR